MSNEPVAWVKTENFVDDDGLWSGRIVFNQHGDGMPLYTHPVDDTALLRRCLNVLLNDCDPKADIITALRERLGEKK